MPGKTPTPQATAETIAGWRTRRGALLAKLDADPDGPWAWLWRVHVDIMDYLLHRYAGVSHDAPVQDQADEGSGAVAADDAMADTIDGLAEPYGRVTFRKAASLEGEAGEVLRSTMRERLASLHTTNTERRKAQPPILPTPPPLGFRYNPTGLRPMPRWVERLFTLPDHALFPQESRGPGSHGYWVLRTTYPEQFHDDAAGTEQTGLDPLDAESLALLQHALAEDKDWQLDDGRAWSDEEIARMLSGDAPGGRPTPGDSAGT